jgi:bacteriorhodopsin
VGAIALLTYGLTAGDWSNFIQQWQSDRFIHVMSLDFCMLCLLFPALIGDDMARRGLQDKRIFWAVALVPLLGAIAYLTLRPPLESAPERELSPQG